MRDDKEDLIELLAAMEHLQWIAWTKNLVLCGERISKKRLDRWQKLWATPYDQLPVPEKRKDREFATRAYEALELVGAL